jgi:hypothetical protein
MIPSTGGLNGNRNPGSHLGETEFVDHLDGVLAPERSAHLDTCASCGKHAASLANIVRDGAAIEVPEPSPLFWDAFSARVREAIDAEPDPRGGRWAMSPWHRLRWATLAIATTAIVGIAVWRLTPPSPALVDPAMPPTASIGAAAAAVSLADAAAAPLDDTFGDIDTDEGWALVRSVAEDMSPDDIDAAGVTLRPGSADGMALRLTARERAELAQLVEEAIKRGRGESSI